MVFEPLATWGSPGFFHYSGIAHDIVLGFGVFSTRTLLSHIVASGSLVGSETGGSQLLTGRP